MLLTLSCAQQPAPDASGTAAADEERSPARTRLANCFRPMDVDNWRVLDDRRMIVFGPGRRGAWQLDFFGSCHGVGFAEVLAFRARSSSWLCGDPGDEIIWRENRCSIRAVRALAPAELELLLNPDVRDDIGKNPL